MAHKFTDKEINDYCGRFGYDSDILARLTEDEKETLFSEMEAQKEGLVVNDGILGYLGMELIRRQLKASGI